jgi:hypothetical protein
MEGGSIWRGVFEDEAELDLVEFIVRLMYGFTLLLPDAAAPLSAVEVGP